MAKYRTKTKFIDAVQWLKPGDHPAVVPNTVESPMDYESYGIQTNFGFMQIFPGDFVVTHSNGKVYPLRRSTFEEDYEPVIEGEGEV